jgi:hypothetical protein
MQKVDFSKISFWESLPQQVEKSFAHHKITFKTSCLAYLPQIIY